MLRKESDYEYLRNLVQTESSNMMDPTYNGMFETRLMPLAMKAGAATLSEFVSMLRSQAPGPMHRLVAEKMTINETSFFRDIEVFDTLRNEVLPRLIEHQQNTRTLRIWSAASATGQEAYSLAILLEELAPDVTHRWDVRIVGTDYSADMVKYAQAGCYKRIEINRGLPARLMVKYFVRHGEEWEIRPNLRRLCQFRQANLCTPMPPTPVFDLVLLRNVLIYFSPNDRAKILKTVRRRMAPHGTLLLGSGEQANGAEDLFETIVTGKTYYYRPLQQAA